jgi:phosphopantetheinyl transferase (holo-ACP synthase)
MIGNDVVDLALASLQSNWRRTGYLDKLFTQKEQNYIFNATNPDVMVWKLWTMKEAVYKIIIQQNGQRGYYPLRIEISDIKSGNVSFEDQVYYTQTKLTSDFIHTVALLNTQFDNVKELTKHYEVIKTGEIPYAILKTAKQPISKSHHGRFVKVVTLKNFIMKG